MAVVKDPALSTAASGNLGSICYAKHRGVTVARGVWTGTYPGTAKQLSSNTRMTQVSVAWGSTLTEDERQAWNKYALKEVFYNRFGDPYTPTGYGVFMKYNLQRRQWGQPIITEPITTFDLEPPGKIWFVYRPEFPTIILNLGSYLFGAHNGYGTQYWKAGPYDSQGRKPTEGEWRQYATRIPPIQTSTGVGVAGKWYWGRARQIWESGKVSNWWVEQEQWPAV